MFIVYTLKLPNVTILQNSDNSEYFLLLILIANLENRPWSLLKTCCACFKLLPLHLSILQKIKPHNQCYWFRILSQWAQEERSRVHISANVRFQVWPLRSDEDKHYIATLNERALGRAWNTVRQTSTSSLAYFCWIFSKSRLCRS